MDHQAELGVRAKYVIPPFVTMTSPSHFTIVTGQHEENHGVIHNKFFNPETGVIKSFEATLNISEWWDHGALPIWITAQNQGLLTGSVHYPGGGATYGMKKANRAVVQPPRFDYGDEKLWKECADKALNWLQGVESDGKLSSEVQALDFVSLYFGEPDHTGHVYGPESSKIRELVTKLDGLVGYIVSEISARGLQESLNVILTSDHGMTRVKPHPEIVLSKYIDFKTEVDFYILNYGPSGLIYPKPGKEDIVYQKLHGAHPGLNVYRKEDFPKKYHYAGSDRILPIIVYGDPGYLVNGKIIMQWMNGQHGYDSEEPDMRMFFRAWGPNFKQSYVAEPFEVVHVYALMCTLLGFEPGPCDSNATVTADMLN
uniref:Zgc:153896 n=1 Tax=Eptatretus burgeri TaxID=7764 RepID=A0A8C4NL77_EPTBU